MPWPQNSRTIENPFDSAKRWIVCPMSPRCAPGRTARMPRHIASYVASTSRLARIDGVPTMNIRLESPWKPSLITVTSMLTMSPGLSLRSPGMPWQTTWLIDVHSDAGNGRCPGGA